MPGSAEDESSPPYKIFETRQYLRDLDRLGGAARARLESKLREYVYPALCDNPRWGPNTKLLKNWEPATWRYRVGDWRFFYEIDDRRRIVFMTAADHRNQAYR